MNPLKVASNYIKLSYDYSSVQFDFPPEAASEIYNWGLKNIPDNILAKDGREDNIHVTVKYGIHTADIEPFIKLFAKEEPILVTLGKISLFDSDDDHSVVKIDVSSSDLYRLNKLISDSFEVTDTFPEYHPHVTIAYIKKNKSTPYINRKDFVGKKVILDSLVFSGKDDKKTLFKLN